MCFFTLEVGRRKEVLKTSASGMSEKTGPDLKWDGLSVEVILAVELVAERCEP